MRKIGKHAEIDKNQGFCLKVRESEIKAEIV